MESRFSHCRHSIENGREIYKAWKESRAQEEAEINEIWDNRTEEQLKEWRRNSWFREVESWRIRDGKGPWLAAEKYQGPQEAEK